MTEKEQKKAAKEFAQRWQGKGYEKGQSQQFWMDLLEHVYGVKDIVGFISFEDQVHLDNTSFIDGYISSTHVMIEQKSIGKNLRKAIRQSDGSLLNPFQQAKRYVTELPLSQHPRWIVTCNFEEFLVYDMEKPNGEPEQILLKDLAKDYYRLQFLVDTGNENLKKEMEISLKAGELVGKMYDAILKQYKNPESEAEMFLGKTDFKLNSMKGEEYAYQCVLGACAENSIYEINEMLKENGITPFGSDPSLQ